MSHSRASPRPTSSASQGKSRGSFKSTTTVRDQVQNQGKGLGLLPSPDIDSPTAIERKQSDSPNPKTVGFDERALQREGDHSAVEEGYSVEQEQGADPNFQPFFTLISDALTAEHYHPTVRYIFADDEEGEEIVCQGVLSGLGGLIGHSNDREDVGPKQQREEKEQVHVKEHVLILDIDAKADEPGFEVTQAQSLSAEWQIGGVEIVSAPTMSEGDGDAGLMLKIEGRGPLESRSEMGRESLESLLLEYERGLGEIRRMARLSEQEGR